MYVHMYYSNIAVSCGIFESAGYYNQPIQMTKASFTRRITIRILILDANPCAFTRTEPSGLACKPTCLPPSRISAARLASNSTGGGKSERSEEPWPEWSYTI